MPEVLDPVVGASVPRVDGRAKVTGEARYVDDLPVPGVLHGATVRTSVAHGVLRALTVDPALDRGRVTIVTAADIPGRNTILLELEDQPALVPIGSEVRHVGEAVALVAAPTRAEALAAARLVRVDAEPLPAVLTLEDALARGDVFREFHLGHGDVDAALAAAHLVVEGEYRTGPAEHAYLEPQGMVAEWRADGSVTVTGSLQCPYYVHRALVALLGLPAERVVVRQAVTGGGFGGKEEYPSMVAAHAVLLARAAGRPVKLVYDRAEDVAATTKRHPSLVRHRLAVAADGTFLGADVDVVLDGGAYVTLSPVVLLRACAHAAGPYRLPAVRIRGRVVFTNHHPSGAFRGFGAPQAHFAAERQVAKAARALRMDPLALRRLNALRPGDVSATGAPLDDSAGLPAVLDALSETLAAPVPAGARPVRSGARVRRGRGIAAGFHGAGFTGAGEALLGSRAEVARVPGRGFEVRVSSTELGQGASTTLAQIAAQALGVPMDEVRVVDADTSVVPNSGPTVASRTLMIVGSVVERAARSLRAQIEGGAEGAIVASAVYEPPPGVRWDAATTSGHAYAAFGWAACAVDVAVDEDTSEVTVERCVEVVDCGKAVNPLIVRGQVEGGAVQGLGWALWERCSRIGGRVVNANLSDYTIATALDAPEVESVLVEVPYRYGPSGAKGIGELPLNVPAAAVANAIEDALGVAADELPLVPEVLHRLRVGGAP